MSRTPSSPHEELMFKACSRNTYHKENVFNKIMNGDLPSTKVFDDDQIMAIKDINPVAPVHILVVPKKEFFSFDDWVANTSPEEIGGFFKKVRKIAVDSGCQENGYRIVMNHGMFSEQIVPHFHVHILGGRVLGQMSTVPDHMPDHGRIHPDKKEEKKEEAAAKKE